MGATVESGKVQISPIGNLPIAPSCRFSRPDWPRRMDLVPPQGFHHNPRCPGRPPPIFRVLLDRGRSLCSHQKHTLTHSHLHLSAAPADQGVPRPTTATMPSCVRRARAAGTTPRLRVQRVIEQSPRGGGQMARRGSIHVPQSQIEDGTTRQHTRSLARCADSPCRPV